MAGFNRGEWSETLATLALLEDPCLRIVDGNLEPIRSDLFTIKEDGNVVLLDSIYHREEVCEFLVNETRLDTPSRTRYHMLELNPVEGMKNTYTFTLNLQIRYKK